MKKLALNGKLKLNKVTVSELNHLVGGGGEFVELVLVERKKKSKKVCCPNTDVQYETKK